MNSSILTFWGKARPFGAVPCHPAAYHSLDVAASARVLLDELPLVRRRVLDMLGSDGPDLLVALIALHDVGKWSRPFQAIVPALYPPDLGDAAEGPRHDEAGFWLWRDRLADDLADLMPDGVSLMPLARAVFGHHGQPVDEASPPRLRALYGSHGLACGTKFAREAVSLILPRPVRVRKNAPVERASWLVAGLAVLADWIGSSQAWFPYTPPTTSLADYWGVTLVRAQRAVRRSGVIPAAVSASQSYASLTGVPDWQPSDMQAWAEAVPADRGLYVIEDATGSGKTETALMLAHRLMAAGHAEGVFVALPTMATSDAMFSRLRTAYRRLFAADGLPSLVLAHGSATLNAEFSSSILPDGEGSCAAWIADNRRKAFLAQVGVGTIDQAILSILPSRHQSLRTIGLVQRVLILDEVHAYDAYMCQEIVRLLEMHAALGGSAILLSATLPASVKRRLLRAYGAGQVEFSQAYPLATMQTSTTVQTPRAPRPDTIRDVPLRFIETADEGLDIARSAAAAGQAVLYIRNTVADAIEVADGATVFHAGFALCDRLAIQADVLQTFGRNSTPEQRRGRFLVATQVVEQSLDVDFDLIVSDLAPVDLIIQRAGRLWRHLRQRPAGAVREFVVVGPSPDADARPDWLRSSLRRTSFVYSDHARMWLTAETLRAAGAIRAPHGLRPMIEHVYSSDPRVPAGLLPSLMAADGTAGAHRGFAASSTLRPGNGYGRTGPWLSEDRIPTRLGIASTRVRLAAVRDGRVIPWAATRTTETDDRRLWALSEIGVASYRADGELIPQPLAAAAAAAKETWSRWDHEDIPLAIVIDGTCDLSLKGRPVSFRYCNRFGMRGE